MKRYIALFALLFVAAVSAVWAVSGQQDHFKHTDHARLFPACTSCHAGIEKGDQASFYPAPTDCARCHDDERMPKVNWTGPTRVASNLSFSHPDHMDASNGVQCVSCHASKQGKPAYMNVARAEPETCLACHAKNQKATGPIVHLASTNDCTLCHVPLKNAKLEQNQIASLPKPPSHAEAGFFAGHKNTTLANTKTCATCHTQESCQRCHANAGSIKVITALGSNDRVAALTVGKPAVYPKPADHASAGFRAQHGALANSNIGRCSNCHTRESCQQCHAGSSAADQLAKLPIRVAGLATGVDLKSRVRSAHPAGFANNHAVSAGAGGESCTSCHQQKFCSSCHQGSDSRKFHAANFASKHATAVYSGEQECSSCHNRESFCQTCHTGLGLNSAGRRTTQFHTGQSIWLLQHGQAARQSLESCASCHAQSSCTRCHASNAKGGWGVNPHGSMDVSKIKDKNQGVCLQCHEKDAIK